MDQFQRGKKHIAIISDAASTGISLHSEKLAREPQSGRRRIHVTLEMPWSPEKVLQQLGNFRCLPQLQIMFYIVLILPGRTNRTNQSSRPVYFFFESPIPAEVRFTSTIVSRLRSMVCLQY